MELIALCLVHLYHIVMAYNNMVTFKFFLEELATELSWRHTIHSLESSIKVGQA